MRVVRPWVTVDRLLFTPVHTPIRLVITDDAEALHSLGPLNRALIYSTDRRTQGFDVPGQHRDHLCSHDVINLFQPNNIKTAHLSRTDGSTEWSAGAQPSPTPRASSRRPRPRHLCLRGRA